MRKKLSLLTFLMMFCSFLFGQTPDWGDFNYRDYDFNMTVTAVVEIDDDEQANSNLIVAPFYGNERRGNIISGQVISGRTYYYLGIFGNYGDVVTFKLYDSENQTEYISSSSVNFVPNGIVGSASNPYIVNFNSVAKVGDVKFGSVIDAVNYAEAGQTVTLTNDSEITSTVVINKAITLDLNGKKVEQVADKNAVRVTSDNVIITDSSENGDGAILNELFYAVTVGRNDQSDRGSLTINGGKFEGQTTSVYVACGDLEIRGGEFSINEIDPQGYKYVVNLLGNKDANALIYGGTFHNFNPQNNEAEGVGTNFCAEGYIAKDNGNNTYTVIADPAYGMVARIGDTYFATLEAAIEAAQDGDEIDLLTNVTIANPINVTFDLTIDGNGKTLTYTGSNRAITVEAEANGADLTVKNLTVDCTSSYCPRGINYNTNGALTLEGVTVKGTNVTYALNLPGSSDGATVTINNSSLTANIALNIWGEGAEITATDSHFISVDNSTAEGYAAIKFNNDGATSAENTSLNVVGGSIIAYKEDGTTPSIALEILTETDNYNISSTTTVVGDIVKSVAIVKYTNTTDFYSCAKLQAAIDEAIATNGSVKVIRDITASEIIAINGAVVIDLNGKTVTSTAKKAFEVYANATIMNGTIYGAERAVDTRKNVTLSLADVALGTTSTTGNPQPLTIGGSEDGTVVTLSNVNINAGTSGYGIITFVKTNLTAENSTISGFSALYIKPGSEESSFSFVNSTLSGSTAGNDTEANSFSVIALRANDVTVTVDKNSTVTSTGDYSHAISLGGIFENEETTSGNNVTIAGTIEGNILYGKCIEANTVRINEAYASNLQAEGFITSEAENGLVTVIGTAAAKIGDTYFATLEAAINAAQDGDEIKVLRNSAGAGAMIKNSITIDFGGYTYTFNKAYTKTKYGFYMLNMWSSKNVTLKNGTLTSTETLEDAQVETLVYNCVNLTLKDMNIVDATDHIKYALSLNSGETKIIGNTSITSDAIAFDAYDYSKILDLPVVNVETTGTIDGGIEVSATLNIIKANLTDDSYIVLQGNGQLFHNGITTTVKKEITASKEEGAVGATTNWNTISTPVVGKSAIPEAEAGRHDLYYYDEANQYWRYQETGDLVSGKGYLYTNHEEIKFSFTGKLNTAAVDVSLSYTDGIALAGFNLVGNPFTHKISVENMVSEADLADGFYTITKEGAWQVRQAEETIAPLQSVLVKADKAATLTINPKANKTRKASNASLEIAVYNSEYEDVAYVSFGEGLGLDKIEHRNSDIPMVFIPVNGKEYAIATMSSDVKEIPVAFKAMTMGQYTFAVNAKDCEFSEMYLVDNLTGEITDLLNNEYTFLATSKDDANRFVIKFAEETETTTSTENFAYINNGEIIIDSIEGKGVVKIYDMLGRPMSEYGVSESARISTSAFADGIYIIQMSDDNGVKVQKVVID